jgi:hypothetical protein
VLPRPLWSRLCMFPPFSVFFFCLFLSFIAALPYFSALSAAPLFPLSPLPFFTQFLCFPPPPPLRFDSLLCSSSLPSSLPPSLPFLRLVSVNPLRVLLSYLLFFFFFASLVPEVLVLAPSPASYYPPFLLFSLVFSICFSSRISRRLSFFPPFPFRLASSLLSLCCLSFPLVPSLPRFMAPHWCDAFPFTPRPSPRPQACGGAGGGAPQASG